MQRLTGLGDRGVRKLANMAVNVSALEIAPFRDAWNLIRRAVITDA
jgi:hypothetical protein